MALTGGVRSRLVTQALPANTFADGQAHHSLQGIPDFVDHAALWGRIKLMFTAVVLLGFATYGLWAHQLSLGSGRRRFGWFFWEPTRRQPVHYHHDPAIVLSIGLLLISFAMFSWIAKPFAQPKNAERLRQLAIYLAMPGIALVILAMTHR